MGQILTGALLVLIGVFGVTAAYCDWEWFMETWRMRFWISIFGRTGGRIFLALLGLGATAAGVLKLMGSM
jgi:hypothetical protein